jgi:hypothetical protein
VTARGAAGGDHASWPATWLRSPIQDKYFLGGAFSDPYFEARRDSLFLIAVDCMYPAETCFCASTGDGPRGDSGFDIALSELEEDFIVRSGSAGGQDVA